MPAGTLLFLGTPHLEARAKRQPGATRDGWRAHGAFAIDPDGNHIEAVCRLPVTR